MWSALSATKFQTSRKRGFFMAKDFMFTSESVCAGHPDKICDQISDAILDAVLTQDRLGRAAVETMATHNRVVIVGEVTSQAKVNFKKIAQDQIKRLGYVDDSLNFSYRSPIDVYVHSQSREISAGVDQKGAGDQGMMFGFACKETENLMPMPIQLAHMLTQKIDTVREDGVLPYLRPDGKSQVTVEYKNDKPYKVKKVVIAVPHKESVGLKEVKEDIFREVVSPVLAGYGFNMLKKDLVVNGTGVWHFSGPAADSGLTGRKIVVDSYGGYARVGGGCFSGKDPTKVDRSGAYAARFIAKNIVAHGLADKAEVSLAYFIGAKKPVMQEVETFGSTRVPIRIIRSFVSKIIDTSVHGIITKLDLQRPIYLKTAAYGHFGRDGFPWEQVVR